MVRKVQSCCSLLGLRVPGSSTAAYCAARKRFKYTDLLGIHKAVTGSIQSSSPSESLCKGLDVKVVDGTGIAMPDTPENQSEFPQPSLQKPGCGFPVITLVACFSLASGALLHWVESTLKSHESRIFRKMLVRDIKDIPPVMNSTPAEPMRVPHEEEVVSGNPRAIWIEFKYGK